MIDSLREGKVLGQFEKMFSPRTETSFNIDSLTH